MIFSSIPLPLQVSPGHLREKYSSCATVYVDYSISQPDLRIAVQWWVQIGDRPLILPICTFIWLSFSVLRLKNWCQLHIDFHFHFNLRVDGRRETHLIKKSPQKYLSLLEALLLLRHCWTQWEERRVLLNVSGIKYFFMRNGPGAMCTDCPGSCSRKEGQLVPYWHQSVSAFTAHWVVSDFPHRTFFIPALFLYWNALSFQEKCIKPVLRNNFSR